MNDRELESWRAQWQTATPPPRDLSVRVERETRMMRRWLLGEIVVTVAFGGGTAGWAALSGRTDALVLALGVWAFIAIAWTVSILLRRDAWAPATSNTAAFLDLSILRCRRRREAIVAQTVLYVIILAFDLTWIYFAGRERSTRDVVSFLTSWSVAWLWPVTAALGIAAAIRRQRLTRELQALTDLRASLDDSSPQPQVGQRPGPAAQRSPGARGEGDDRSR